MPPEPGPAHARRPGSRSAWNDGERSRSRDDIGCRRRSDHEIGRVDDIGVEPVQFALVAVLSRPKSRTRQVSCAQCGGVRHDGGLSRIVVRAGRGPGMHPTLCLATCVSRQTIFRAQPNGHQSSRERKWCVRPTFRRRQLYSGTREHRAFQIGDTIAICSHSLVQHFCVGQTSRTATVDRPFPSSCSCLVSKRSQ